MERRESRPSTFAENTGGDARTPSKLRQQYTDPIVQATADFEKTDTSDRGRFLDEVISGVRRSSSQQCSCSSLQHSALKHRRWRLQAADRRGCEGAGCW